jgi:hypothetical protein
MRKQADALKVCPIPDACLLVMAQRPYRLLGLPETRSFIFLITNSPDQAEGYLDYLQHMVLCAGVPCTMTPFSHHLTPPRLRTGESMHLVSFWPSPTPRARRERQLGASGMRWWVRTARFCVQEGCFFPCKIMTHFRLIRHRPVSAQANQCT